MGNIYAFNKILILQECGFCGLIIASVKLFLRYVDNFMRSSK